MKSLRKQRSPIRRSRQLQLEPLESRRLLAPVNVPVNGVQDFTQTDPAMIVHGDDVRVLYTDGQYGTGVAISNNQGQSFVIQPFGGGGSGQPATAYDPIANQDYLATLSSTFARAVLVTGSQSKTLFVVGDSRYSVAGPAIAADSNGADQNVYVLAQSYDATAPIDIEHAGMYFLHSSDGGQTWSASQRLTSNRLAGNGWLAIGADHSVNAFWQSYSNGISSIVVRRSTDGGVTFGPAAIVGGQHASRVQVVTNPVSGDLYATYAETFPGTSGQDVMFTMSTDNGVTWSVPAAVNDDGSLSHQYAPTIAVAPNGERLFIGFRDQRLHPDQGLADSFGTIGVIDGDAVSFGANFRISNVSTPSVDVSPSFRKVSGKENQAAADASGFYYAWSDSRNPVSDGSAQHQDDVFLARIGLNGPGGPYVYSHDREQLQVNTAVTSATVTFSEAMDTTSFSVADDVVAFSGNGQDLKSTITGFTWLGDRALRINFQPIVATGMYSLVLGPNVLSATGTPQDNDFDGASGESSDATIIKIPIDRLPQYQAYAAPASAEFQLTRGAPGVVDLGTSSNDDILHIDLGNRTFTFYEHQYTGQQLHLLRPGILTFGTRFSPSFATPAEPVINVLAGATNRTSVLYAFRDVTGDGTEDLIIDWQSEDKLLRFQAVLQLGTGSKQGTILLNYADLDDAQPRSNANSTRIGVRNNGVPAESSAPFYTNGVGDIGLRSGMALLIRDELRGAENLRLGNALHAFGSSGNDSLSVSYQNGMYHIQRNSTSFAFDAAGVEALYLHGGGGNDQLAAGDLASGVLVGLDGNGGKDTLTATGNAPKSLFGGSGIDRLQGGGGNDELEGGPANDHLAGGHGNDRYYFASKTVGEEVDLLEELVDAGVDTLDFSMMPFASGVDVDLRSAANMATAPGRHVRPLISGQQANLENVLGGEGADHLTGNDAANVLDGGTNHDELRGGRGNDLLIGGAGYDTLAGGQGNDRFLLSPAVTQEQDTIQESADQGNDTLDFSSLPAGVHLTLNLAGLPDGTLGKHTGRTLLGDGANIERVLGGAGNDTITGNAIANQLVGNDGNDRLFGAGGNDALYGGVGLDYLNGGSGNDQLYGGIGDDRYVFGLPVGNEVDYVFEVFNAGVDELDFSPLPASIPVTINLGQNNLATHAGRKVWTGIKNTYLNLENATGGAGDDTLIGNTQPNRLVGGLGDDTFDGGGGTDQLVQ